MRPDDKSVEDYQARYSHLDERYMRSVDISYEDVKEIMLRFSGKGGTTSMSDKVVIDKLSFKVFGTTQPPTQESTAPETNIECTLFCRGSRLGDPDVTSHHVLLYNHYATRQTRLVENGGQRFQCLLRRELSGTVFPVF